MYVCSWRGLQSHLGREVTSDLMSHTGLWSPAGKYYFLNMPVPGRQRPGSQDVHVSLNGCVSKSHRGPPDTCEFTRGQHRGSSLLLSAPGVLLRRCSGQAWGLHAFSLPSLPCKLLFMCQTSKSILQEASGISPSSMISHGNRVP